jgi:uncharacterized membrane protein
MAQNKALIAVALASLLTAGTAAATDTSSHGKCWGVAKAGQNDCGSKKNGAHSCKGQSKVDNSMDDFKLSTKAECDEWKGTFEAMPKKPMSK